MALFTLLNAHLAWGDLPLLDGAQLTIDPGERVGLIGRNGTGKSSLLSVLAGKTKLDDGELQYTDGLRTVFVEQEPLLPEAPTVLESLALRGRLQDISDEREVWRLRARIEEMLHRFDLDVDTDPAKASGGEKKRAALALALALEPDLLLLDEPLSALDPPLRKSIRSAIRSIHDTLGITMLYVTHDREEAFTISDSILIMHDGKAVAKGNAEELYRHPESLFTAFFTGEGTAIPAYLVYENTDGYLFFRPEDAVLSEEPLDPELYPMHVIFNDLEVVSEAFMGSGYLLGMEYQGYPMLSLSHTKPRKKHVSLMILAASMQNIAQ